MRNVAVAIALTLIAAVASFALEGVEAKEAAAEKKGDALKLERAAELDAMREFENVSPTLAVGVESCVLRPVEAPKKKEKEGEGVAVEGGDWGSLAGALFRAVER
ncbi:MAG: hypothetical protein JSU81_11220, partial [Candidatus Coatesbacteria bacterium]